jgi:hypothetical protein
VTWTSRHPHPAFAQVARRFQFIQITHQEALALGAGATDLNILGAAAPLASGRSRRIRDHITLAESENKRTPAVRRPGSFHSDQDGLRENQVFFAPVAAPGTPGMGGAGGASSVGGAAAGAGGGATAGAGGAISGAATGAVAWAAGAAIAFDGVCGVPYPGLTFEGVPGVCDETYGRVLLGAIPACPVVTGPPTAG